MNFQERRNKIQMLQARANEFNRQEDEIVENSATFDPFAARKQVLDQMTLPGRNQPITTLPYNDCQEIHGVSKNTSQGYANTHHGPTSYGTFGEKTQQQFSAVKTMRQSEQLTKDFNAKLAAEKEENNQRIKFFKKDHVKMMFEGVQTEDTKKSVYGETHVYTKEFDKDVQNHDLTFHARKNDINVFTDSFAKHKKTMRK